MDVCLGGGESARGVSAGGYPSISMGQTPPVNRITDRCKNITLPQTSFVGCKNIYDWKIRSPEHSPLFSDAIDLARVSRLYFTFLDLLPTQIASPKNIHKQNVFVGDQIRLALSVVFSSFFL